MKVDRHTMSKRSHHKTLKEPDYGQILQEHQPSPNTAAELAVSEHTQSNEIRNLAPIFGDFSSTNSAGGSGGKNNQMNSPKRGLRSQKLGAAEPTIKPGWRHEGYLLNIPYSSSDQRSRDASGKPHPQPGDKEWEDIESAWEQKLEERGFKTVMEEIRTQSPDKYRELQFRARPESAQLAHGEDEYSRQYNEVLEASIPTVAFLLTQQHFGQRVSSLNGEEPLTRKHDSKKVGIADAYGAAPDGETEVVHHEKEDEDFLKNYGESARLLKEPW